MFFSSILFLAILVINLPFITAGANAQDQTQMDVYENQQLRRFTVKAKFLFMAAIIAAKTLVLSMKDGGLDSPKGRGAIILPTTYSYLRFRQNRSVKMLSSARPLPSILI